MPMWPAASLNDGILGVDIHAVVGFPIHPYFGPIFLWSDPTFPRANVFINGKPACSVGAMGYYAHIPQGMPVPPTPTNISYWKRYLMNIPMALCLITLTIFANIAIAGIASLIPKPKSAESFIKEVTGIDTSSSAATWQSVKGSFSALIQWPTWVKLLMPPMPFCGAQGSTAVGSPKVTVNGGPLAFVAPLMATSCTDIPVVPNGMVLGFSNVLVNMSYDDMKHALLVNSARGAVGAGVGAAANKAGLGKLFCACKL